MLHLSAGDPRFSHPHSISRDWSLRSFTLDHRLTPSTRNLPSPPRALSRASPPRRSRSDCPTVAASVPALSSSSVSTPARSPATPQPLRLAGLFAAADSSGGGRRAPPGLATLQGRPVGATARTPPCALLGQELSAAVRAARGVPPLQLPQAFDELWCRMSVYPDVDRDRLSSLFEGVQTPDALVAVIKVAADRFAYDPSSGAAVLGGWQPSLADHELPPQPLTREAINTEVWRLMEHAVTPPDWPLLDTSLALSLASAPIPRDLQAAIDLASL